MAKGTGEGTPSTMDNLVLVTIIQNLHQVDIFAATVLPMQLTNLSIVMKEIQAALAPPPTAGADLTDPARGDLDLVDLFFGQGLAPVVGVVELAAT